MYILFITRERIMFRRFVIAIFRLYMKYLVGSYTKHIYVQLIWGMEGVNWARDLVFVLKVGWYGLHGESVLLPSYI